MSEQHKPTPNEIPQTNDVLSEGFVELTDEQLDLLASTAAQNNLATNTPFDTFNPYDEIDVDSELGLYLYEISQVPLLTAEQEIELAQRIEHGNMLNASEEEQNLGHLALQELVRANTRLVIHLARRRGSFGVELSDLIQAGNIGIIKAAERFKWDKGFRFTTYATHWVKQHIDREILNHGKTIRIPIHLSYRLRRINAAKKRLASDLGRDATLQELSDELQIPVEKIIIAIETNRAILSLNAVAGEDGSELGEFLPATMNTEKIALQSILAEEVERVLQKLSHRDAEVVRMRFALGQYDRVYTLDEVGKKFGLTRERVRQIQNEALQAFRKPSNARLLKDYLE